MDNFDLRKYIAEGRLLEDLQVTSNGNFEVNEEIYVSLGGEEYTGTIDEEGNTLFIHYYDEEGYYGRGDVPDIFNRMEELGGELHFDDDEASISINIDQLKESVNETVTPPYKLETGNVYLLPNGQILTITSGIDQGERLTYTIFTPKTGETAEEWNHYKKMVSNPGKWKILHEPSNESVNEDTDEYPED